jgi:GMP synthase-like glutamine amidotransferase
MKTVCVIQHTETEYLGLMEDHLEGRNIRFLYSRPFAAGGTLPSSIEGLDGLILLGGGPYGMVSGHLLPSMGPELRLTKAFLDAGLPVIGIELGALILSVAGGGGAEEAPLRFSVTTAAASGPGLLGGHMPATFPLALYLRDRAVLPKDATVLATDPAGEPLVFSMGGNCLGFVGHPGMKRGMAEDLIMEFADTPENTVESLEALGAAQGEIASVLSDLMVGVCLQAGLM